MKNSKKQERIAGLIYAGGRGKRMGGVDKALIGVPPSIELMTKALAPFVDQVFISRQADQADLSEFGHIILDMYPDQGPLGGLVSAIRQMQDFDYVLTAAVDADGLPENYFERMRSNARPHAMAITDEDVHPTFALIKIDEANEIAEGFEAGERRLRFWAHAETCKFVTFLSTELKNVNEDQKY